jgi:hypothetical protein
MILLFTVIDILSITYLVSYFLSWYAVTHMLFQVIIKESMVYLRGLLPSVDIRAIYYALFASHCTSHCYLMHMKSRPRSRRYRHAQGSEQSGLRTLPLSRQSLVAARVFCFRQLVWEFRVRPTRHHSMEVFTLNCWVRGPYVGNIFEVKISKTETVAALKEAIKNKKPVAFRDVDVDTLALYNVSLPDASDPQLEESLNKLSLDKEERLGAQTKLSKVFPESAPGDDTTTIIVIKVPNSRAWLFVGQCCRLPVAVHHYD